MTQAHLLPARFTVFEAENTDLSESYLGATQSPIFETMAQLSRSLPVAIRHWRPDKQRVNFRSLEFNLTKDAARVYITDYVSTRAHSGWKYFVEPG